MMSVILLLKRVVLPMTSTLVLTAADVVWSNKLLVISLSKRVASQSSVTSALALTAADAVWSNELSRGMLHASLLLSVLPLIRFPSSLCTSPFA